MRPSAVPALLLLALAPGLWIAVGVATFYIVLQGRFPSRVLFARFWLWGIAGTLGLAYGLALVR